MAPPKAGCCKVVAFLADYLEKRLRPETRQELETHLTRQAAGSYSVVVQGFDPATGSVVMEGSAAFTVAVATKLTGSIVLDPPILQFGAGQSTAMTVNVSNGGNAPLSPAP